MMIFPLFISILPIISSVASALENHNEKLDSPQLKFDFIRRSNDPQLVKRSSNYEDLEFSNEVSGYYLNITLGTPAQEIEVELNFADSELQVFKDSIPHCIENNPVTTSTYRQDYTKTVIAVMSNTVTCSGRSFNTKKSKTYSDKVADMFGDEEVSPWYKFNYGTALVQGNYAKDTLSIGNIKLNDFIFLSSNDSTYRQSALGLGPTESEYTNLVKNGTTYPNFLDRLVKDGYISHRIYSLYANDMASSSGSIIFGGIDHSKYSGSLITVPITKDDRYDSINSATIFRLGLTVQGTGLESNDNNVTFKNYAATNYLFTPNSQMTWLPAPVFDNLMVELNATFNNFTNGRPTPYHHFISCPTNEEAFDTKLVFNIGGVLFKVPLYNFINYKDEELNRCYLGLDKGYGSNLGTLGSAFARSFYIVVDLDDMQLSFAPMVFDSEEGQIEELPQGLSSINSAPDYTRSWRAEDDLTSTINADDVFTLSSIYQASHTYAGEGNDDITFPDNTVMRDILKGPVTVTSYIKDSKTTSTSTGSSTKNSASGSYSELTSEKNKYYLTILITLLVLGLSV